MGNNNKVITKEIVITKKTEKCPKCDFISKRQSTGCRKIKDIAEGGKAIVLNVKFSKHRCIPCDKIFSIPMEELATPGSRFSKKVRTISVNLISEKNMTFGKASKYMEKNHLVKVPVSTIHDWVIEDV
jgi:hypothetical protein